MKKFIICLLIIVLALSMTAILASCKPDDKTTENGENPLPKKLKVAAATDAGAIKLNGYVGDDGYADKSGIKIVFGEDPVYAATSDADGKFSFYYIDPKAVGKEKALDFLALESQDYDYKAFVDTDNRYGYTTDVNCTVVIALKTAEFDMDDIVPNYEVMATFSQYNQKVPAGYPFSLSPTKTVTKENDGMHRVKLYINGGAQPYLRSNEGGLFMRYVVIGTELRLEYDQFHFGLMRIGQSGAVPLPGQQAAVGTITDSTYIVTPADASLQLNFRGFPNDITDDDNWDDEALIKCTDWQEE